MVTEQDFRETAEHFGVEITTDLPKAGEWYLAGKYNQVHIFKCSKIERGRVYPEPRAYPFKIEDCRRIQHP
jgi:hypothetical protein